MPWRIAAQAKVSVENFGLDEAVIVDGGELRLIQGLGETKMKSSENLPRGILNTTQESVKHDGDVLSASRCRYCPGDVPRGILCPGADAALSTV